MIPLRAENPRRTFAIVNLLLIVLNAAVFLYQVSLPRRSAQRLVENFGVVPSRASQLVAPTQRAGRNAVAPRTESQILPLVTTLFTSMFLHGGLLHIAGNMLFLWVFGGRVEDQMGHLHHLMFYLICGLGPGIAHILANWGSTVPSIGASGAISGVMGAYIGFVPSLEGSHPCSNYRLLLHRSITGRAISRLLVPHPILKRSLSAWRVGSGWRSWWAHIGGFLLGAFLALGT